jgi:hypothetical protein
MCSSGVNATAYPAKLPDGHTSVIILNKDAAADLQLELDFGRDANGALQTETLHAPGLDSREANITTSTKTDSLNNGARLLFPVQWIVRSGGLSRGRLRFICGPG